MKKTIHRLAVVLSSLALAACSHEELPQNESNQLGTESLQLECNSYEQPFSIEGDGEWVISFDYDNGQICYAMPDHGKDAMDIQLFVLENPGVNRRSGRMYIKYPRNESRNRVIVLSQSGMAPQDNGLNAETLTLGNRVYVVGYGYNVLGEKASINSVSRTPIIDVAKANKAGKISIGSMDASFVAHTYSGSSVSELSNDLSADAKFGGKYLGFKGEVGATFGMSDFSRQETEYAISYVEADMQSVHMEMSTSEIINTYMTDAAYRDINGLPGVGRLGQNAGTVYPSSAAGIARLVQTYGTHLVMKARLGGCMKYATTVDISKVKGSYDLKAFANCEYKNTFVQTSVKVNDTYSKSHEENSEAINTIVSVQGGGAAEALALAAMGGDNNENFKAWKESLEDVKNQTLVGLDNMELIPLYDLVDQSLTLEEHGVDGKKRYRDIYNYMNGNKIEDDMSKALNMEYQMGDATHLADIPDFEAESANQDESLVKDYYRGGQAVARICHEYIPVINKMERVRVIYPIVSNKVKYNMGYFTGDPTHRPAKVCWSEDGLSVVSLDERPMEAIKDLYVRGSSFVTETEENTVDATVRAYTVRAPGRDEAHDYPVVKIFNQIWFRDNYQATHTTDGSSINCLLSDMQVPKEYGKDDCYYELKSVQGETFAPQGWRVSSKDDFKSIEKTLNANDVTHITVAKAFFPDAAGGVLGFYHRFNGYGFSGVRNWKTDGYYGCIKADKSFDGVLGITANESFNESTQFDWTTNDETFTVRLVKDIF